MERFLKSRYKIGDKISENHFSVTYRGSVLAGDKPVIIKIYKRGTLNSKLINRMKQKVRELSLINHHGIAKLIDGDYGWQGFYYVREYVPGQNLAELMEKGETGEERARAVAEEVCAALQAAHDRGIVHGALKPENIIISEQGLVKVADFVIEGRIKDAMPQKALSLIDDGKYTSPEELAGRPAAASSDIYVLGMILYEMLANAPLPARGLRGGLARLKGRQFPDRQKLSGQPRYLQDIVLKALRADPLLRFASAGALRRSLVNKSLPEPGIENEEFVNIFENTVTQYGGEDISRESEALSEVGQVKIRWAKEKHRNWILAAVLAAALLSGMIYSFLFGR